MADATVKTEPTKAKIDAAAEQAYAQAAAQNAEATIAKVETTPAKPAAKPVAKKPAAKKAAAKRTPAKKASTKKRAAKMTPAKVAAKKAATPKRAAKRPTAKTKTAAKKAAPKTKPTSPVTNIKETIMATAKKADIATTAKELAADVQERVKTAYAKSGELASEVGEFSKANVEAVAESGKIFFSGAQELVRDNVETSKTVVETVTEDAKKIAAIKSPTELMQLQGELARRNFDAVVSYGSQRTEAWVKLYNEAFAPISNRVSVAAEKISKAA